MKIKPLSILLLTVGYFSSCDYQTQDVLLNSLNWDKFLGQHDMVWEELTSDPEGVNLDFYQRTGYYAGAIMGNGLLGTNMYKLQDSIYRLNVGRSDVKEVRQPYNLFNSARLPIGYFTLNTVGKVTDEHMRLSLYNAVTKGTLTSDKGSINFSTYVHALENYIVFETQAKGEEKGFSWNFVPQQAISPRHWNNRNTPADYLNSEGKANPDPVLKEENDCHFLIQPLATDSSFQTIGKVYVVAWQEKRNEENRRIIATVAQAANEKAAMDEAKQTLKRAFSKSSKRLYIDHKSWWNAFYRKAAFLSFPNTQMESFYWAQYYKFASSTRPGKPVVDLQGVWPTWDTPWPAVWNNLNLQLTYSWQTKANLGELAEPLWESLWKYRDNLQKNVTDVPGQEGWTDAACIGRTSSYDMRAVLNPELAKTNEYEVGNLTWILSYYWKYCKAYGQQEQLMDRFYPMLKAAINLYFHIREEHNGQYGLPATASPEYLVGQSVGPNSNYDLASLRWGLQTLIDLATQYRPDDPMLPQWKDFLDHLVPYPYDEQTGYKVSDQYAFEHTNHRHYSHLFMIYPYYQINWGQKENRDKIALSVNRWKGDQGYSRTGKAAMLLSMAQGDSALVEMEMFLNRFVKPNTLYAESGPVIETPLAALSTLHDFYLQDWDGTLRIFHGFPQAWKEASFAGMRAIGGQLVSAHRKDGNTVFIRVESTQGGDCRIQTDIPLDQLGVRTPSGLLVNYSVIDAEEGIVCIHTKPGDVFDLTNKTLPTVKPTALSHPETEWNFYGDNLNN